MSELVKLNGKAIPSDVLDWILDCFWTGSEKEEKYKHLFDRGLRKSEKETTVVWETICSLSRTSRLLRNLSLPRMTGTLYFKYFKMIGKFWKAVQLNPLLGSFTHTCYFNLYSFVWPFPNTPSQGLERLFKEGAADEALKEVMDRDPDNTHSLEKIDRWRRTGSDGRKREDQIVIISSPEDLRQSLIDIARCWTRIKSLSWDTQALPLLTEIIEHVESLGTLDSLSVNIAGCEERYYLSSTSLPGENSLIIRTPVWKLGQQVSHLDIYSFAFHVSTPLEEDELNSQIDLLTEVLRKAEKLKTLTLRGGFWYPYKTHSQKRYQKFLREILPAIVRTPKIEIPFQLHGPFVHIYYAMQELHSQVEALSIRKHLLQALDVKQLGRKASEEKDHPLACLSHLLEDDEAAERIVKEWNGKYAPS